MSVEKTYPKPKNWQDFETLCLNLWGEMWQVNNRIKKHDRSGQAQHGVDLYVQQLQPKDGIPTGFWGIQCKNINEHFGSALTHVAIRQEIEAAKLFNPPLAYLLIVTTHNTDVEIDRLVRELSTENFSNSKFTIEIMFWQDIENLLDLSYYARQKYLSGISGTSHKVEFILDNIDDDSGYRCDLLKKIKRYKAPEDLSMGMTQQLIPQLDLISKYQRNLPSLGFRLESASESVNRSYIKIKGCFTNIGSIALQNVKLSYRFVSGVKQVSDGMSSIKSLMLALKRNFYIEDDEVNFDTVDTLNQEDSICVVVYVLPVLPLETIVIEWRVNAVDYSDEGTLNVDVFAEYEIDISYVETEQFFDDEITVDYLIK